MHDLETINELNEKAVTVAEEKRTADFETTVFIFARNKGLSLTQAAVFVQKVNDKLNEALEERS